MTKLTIYDIKGLTKLTEPYFFSKETMKWHGQTMKDFKVSLLGDGRYKISAPSGDDCDYKKETVRYFNPENNELEGE